MADRSMTWLTPSLRLHGLEAGDPETGGLVVLLGLLPVVALEVVDLLVALGLLAVAVVGLVVEDQDVLHAHQVGHDALEHLAFGLRASESARPGGPASSERPPFDSSMRLAQLEGVVVGDDDLAPSADLGQHVAGDQLAALVVAVRVVGLEHAQAIADRDAGSDDEEAAGELLAVRPADGVDRLPGDEHRHDRGLAGAGGELQGQSRQIGVGLRRWRPAR